jgi:predicted TIM-barrel fold metal-dependent hydrolase
VNEPRDLWSGNLPASLKDQAMRGIKSGDDGNWTLLFESDHAYQSDMTNEEERLAVLDPKKRMEVMRADGVVGECIFPTIGLFVWHLTDPKGVEASCTIYNDWIVDTLQRHSDRFACAGLIPTTSVESAVAEVERVAEMGLRALMLPTVATPYWNRDTWLPLWDRIAATGLPIVMHQGTGHEYFVYRGPGAALANLMYLQTYGPQVATLLATSGILEKHPDMHVVFVEYNAGWLAWTMETVDYYNTAFRRYDTSLFKDRTPTVYPDLAEPPSFYLKRQVHATFQKDHVSIDNIRRSGVDCLMWGNDFPHEEGTYPHSRKVVAEQARGIDPADARKIFRENAAEVFHFDPAAITPL